MAIRYPGPFGLRIFYTMSFSSVPLQHQMELNIDLAGTPVTPGQLFSDYDIKVRAATTQALDAYVDDWVALIRPFFSNAGGNSIDRAELWEYTPDSFDASFVSTYDIALAGTSVSSTSPSSQGIFTFRSQNGGIMKISLMETVIPAGPTDFPPLLDAARQDLANFVISLNNGFLARDDGWPFALMAFHPGQNEAVFKKRNRA